MSLRRWRRAAMIAGAALVGLLIGCGGDSPPTADASSASGPASVAVSLPRGSTAVAVATVAGTPITEAELRAELNAVGSAPRYLDDVDASLSSTGTGTRSASGGFDPAFVRNLLRRRIVFRLVEDDLVSRGEQPGAACVAAAPTKVADSLGSGNRAPGQAFFAAFPSDYQAELTRWNAELLQLQADLTGLLCDDDAATRQYYDQHTAQFGGRSFDEARADAEKGVQAVTGQAFAGWLDARFATVTITVDPSYGSWDAVAGQIVPP